MNVVVHIEQTPAPLLLGPSEETFWDEECDDDGGKSQNDQVPGTIVRKRLAKAKEHERTNDRPFNRPRAADNHSKNRKCHPVHRKCGVRAYLKRVQICHATSETG